MGLLTWVLVLPAIAAILGATYHEAWLSMAHMCALVSTCLLALFLYQRSRSFGWHLDQRSSTNGAGSTRSNIPMPKVNDSLYELHRPADNPTMQVLFFHGLQSVNDSDGHVKTWKSKDGSVIWPRDWLVADFPGAHIFTMSYNEGVRNLDMFLFGENLTSDLVHGGIGQVRHCPVILVGYCVGGLVIKQICLQAKKMFDSGKISTIARKKLGMFLENVRGVFYYGTPHRGSSVIANIADGPLFGYFKVLNEDAARLNSDFDDLRVSYPKWKVYGLGESLRTQSGLFRGHVVAHEGTSREGDEFHVVVADHNSICQPPNKVDRRFYALKTLIDSIVTNMKEEEKVREETSVQEAHPQNFQPLPEEIIIMDVQVQTIVGKLHNVKTLGFAGMGGLGKTTLARAVFNHLGPSFEYTCFVPDMKLIAGSQDEAKKVVWEHLHHQGKKVERGESWSSLKGRKLLLVLDDISLRDGALLQYLAHDSAPESRFIATSRDQELLSRLGEVFIVPFLNSKNAEALFMKCAFPNQAEPPKELETVMKDVIKKCEGLPLTLEVLGKYLERKRDYEVWEQTLSALRKAEKISTLNGRLWENLRLSYNDLSKEEQQMFLDATTFFCMERRWTLRDAMAAWSVTYDASERLLWQTLVDRSLVYSVGEGDNIKVHEQLQSLGRKIASESSNAAKCRIWDPDVALKMLQTTTKKLDGEVIHSLRLGNSEDLHLPTAVVSKLKKVQFLDVGFVTIDGPKDGASLPTEVVLLKCKGLDLFNPTLQTRLAVLDLAWRSKDPLPPSIEQLECLKELKHLTIRSGYVKTLPNTFGQLRGLRRLTVDDCFHLDSLPESFGQLSSLNCLRFIQCRKLQSLPESFGQLKALSCLEFSYCLELESLPKSFGDLEALKSLTIFEAPKLHTLPESFGQVSTLTELVFCCHNVRHLPASFGQLKNLRRLKIYAKRMKRWPDSFRNLKGLRDLEIGYYSASSIPPDCSQSSLHRLKLWFRVDLVKPLPKWLLTPNVPNHIVLGSKVVFQGQDGGFVLLENESILKGSI